MLLRDAKRRGNVAQNVAVPRTDDGKELAEAEQRLMAVS